MTKKKRIETLEVRQDEIDTRMHRVAERIGYLEKKFDVLAEHIEKLHNNFDETFRLLEKIINEQSEGGTDGQEQQDA